MDVEPRLGPVCFGAHPFCQRPELCGMVHVLEVGHLMSGQIIENEGRREDQAP